MIEVGVGQEPGLGAHEIPGMRTEVEADFEFGDSPVALHRGAGIAFDGEAGELMRQDGCVIDHGETVVQSWWDFGLSVRLRQLLADDFDIDV